MVAIGYTSKGEIKEFRCRYGYLYCSNSDLVSLVGVKRIYSWNNQLSELFIPESVEYLYCDKEIKGLEEFIGNVNIKLW